ncbi:hypothetical protein L6452_39071 [Arctium lappa]|uniref:Uncharacterized protein n=1 Tax=Arctium lappa TaxID=4217 RepID=A0ACB8XRA1_ARCLA|nr:hypothetical protein L6452_39071 [Arctium lappa]
MANGCRGGGGGIPTHFIKNNDGSNPKSRITENPSLGRRRISSLYTTNQPTNQPNQTILSRFLVGRLYF